MNLAPGSTLANYRVTAALGAGGMGEVWRATDEKLGREVALKVLPEEFAKDPERMARFEREAKVLASLNHPNIATLYGLETVALGSGTGSEATTFLAMELVEGEDLSQRIERGSIPVEEAVEIALQIADGLEAAHEQGIVHRDLKPANIKLTEDGVVKVLDFGLAKAWESDGGDSSNSMSPTMTRHATVEGVILGTAAYMSPEQARGKKVDRRADVWSFGVVMWEMLTGRKLFEGETVSDVLADVLRADIDLGRLPSDTSSAVRRVLSRCLVRDPKMRLRDIGDARVELAAPFDVGLGAVPASGGSESRRGARWMWPLTGVVAAIVVTAGMLLLIRSSPHEPVRRFNIAPGNFEVDRDRIPSISPDGSKALWCSRNLLWVQDFSEFDASELPGTTGARFPFWAPDNRAVGFVLDDRVWRLDLGAGSPVSIGSVPPDSMTGSGAGSWGADGRILLAGSHMAGLFEISSRGGEATVFEPLAVEDEADFHNVSQLRGSTAVVVSVHGLAGPNFSLQLISDGERSVLFGGPGHVVGAPVYAPTGHLLFERLDANPGIWALPFSLTRLEVEGKPFMVIPGGQMPSLSDDGTLLFVREGRAVVRRMVWVDADGGTERVLDEIRAYGAVRLSPEGRRVVFQLDDGAGEELWVHDLERSITTKLTHSGGINASPQWMPDGERIIFSSDRGGRGWDLYLVSSDGGSEPTLVYDSDVYGWPNSVTSDGRFVVFSEFDRENRLDLLLLDLENGDVTTIADTEFAESAGALSPDDRWLAYVSEETGQREVYVRPLASASERVQVSNGGGDLPVWSRAGDRLFFRQQDRVMSVSVTVEETKITAGRQEVFATDVGEPRATFIASDVFDVSADGSRLIMSLNDPSNEAAPRLGVVFGFLDELRALAEDAQR
jgi:Tol biopolymer transport system component